MYMQPPLISCIEGKTWPVGPEVFLSQDPSQTEPELLLFFHVNKHVSLCLFLFLGPKNKMNPSWQL